LPIFYFMQGFSFCRTVNRTYGECDDQLMGVCGRKLLD